jgi:FtsP/CotA-like multicopper oxidase with cupredoxin domain
MRIHRDAGLPPARSRLVRVLAGLVSAGSLAVLAAACAAAAGTADPAARPSRAFVSLSLPSDTLTEPMEITSRNGVLDVTLAAVFRTMVVPDSFANGTLVSNTYNLRTYQVMQANGIDYSDSARYGFPGPTLRVFRGDSVHVVLLNQMWDTTTSPTNPADDTTNTACANYDAANGDTITDHFEDCFHGSNWTNIHFHGMHVTPDSVGDDVLLMIPPGGRHEYGFRIPHNQSPGTHWYHPHKHGSVALQVLNGMSGALIVDGGPLDSVADANRMTERLIALQQIDTMPNLMLSQSNGQHFLVNGQVAPVIVMAPGEVQRWRIVNENVSRTNTFEIYIADSTGIEPTLYEVARDGVAFADTNYAWAGTPAPDDSVLMAPGNRLDLFVQAPGNGGIFSVNTRLVSHAVPRDRSRKPLPGRPLGSTATSVATAPSPTAANTFYVMVDPTLPASTSRLPASLPPLPGFLANLPGTMDVAQILADTANLPVIVFADSGFSPDHQNPTRYFLGTQPDPWMKFSSTTTYVPETGLGTPRPMVLDSVQTWKVENRSTSTNHPFHIHINPFQVIDVFYPQGTADPNAMLYAQLDSAAQVRGAPIWLDVIPLPLPQIDTVTEDLFQRIDTIPGYVLIRQAYQPLLNADGSVCTDCGDPTGWFVMHCHILGHEERGMMQVLEIVNPGQQPSPPPQPGGSGSSSAAPAAGRSHRH